MNVFAHVAVARRAAGPAASDRFLVGAALSDLASPAGFRLLGAAPDLEVAAGMAFHHRTDDAFHRHRWFRTRERAARSALEAAGLGRGPARACGHVGVELLLDGALHPDPSDRERFARVLRTVGELAGELAPLVPGPRQGAWVAHLRQVGAVEGVPPYDDPASVADRLQRICRRRPRLAFDLAAVAAVAAVLDELAPSIRATGPGLVADLATQLRSAA